MSSNRDHMRVYMKDRYYRRSENARQQLGGKCALCGSTEDLEFDHIDPETKSFVICQKIASVSEKQLQEELAKCQLLCVECHREKSIEERGMSPRRHGTISMYKNQRCRCEACSEAMSAHNRLYRLRRREESELLLAA